MDEGVKEVLGYALCYYLIVYTILGVVILSSDNQCYYSLGEFLLLGFVLGAVLGIFIVAAVVGD